MTWCTTRSFLDHFGLSDVKDLPGLEELKASGLIDQRPAMASLSARGLLGEGAEQEDDGGEDDGDAPEEAAETLAPDFGEDLVDDGESDDAPAGDALSRAALNRAALNRVGARPAVPPLEALAAPAIGRR